MFLNAQNPMKNLLEKKPVPFKCLEPTPLKTVADLADPQKVAHYQNSIFCHLKETQIQRNPNFMQIQTEISPKMRSILVDWLVDVHVKFRLRSQTLFLTVNLLDNFLEKNVVSRQHLQLVGVTCLMIICKYEEIYPPNLKDYVAVCDNAYTREQILEIEGQILLTVDFDVARPTVLIFLELLQNKIGLEPRAYVFANYILENTLFDLEMLKYSPHTMVAGTLFLVNKIFKRGGWKPFFQGIVGVPEVTAKLCAKDLFTTMQRMENVTLTALKRKFGTPQNFEVSKYRIERARN